jgi:cell division protein FtsN
VLRALTDSRTLKEACQKLSLQAASRRSFVWLVLANMLLVSALVAGYLAFSDHDAPTPTPTPTPTPAQARIPVPASAPAPASALSVSTSPAVAPATTEPVRTAFTKDELQALDAAALRYVPRRPLPVSDVASAPVVVASQAAARAPASSPPLGAIYYINVGLFANDWNARYAQAKLVDAGFVSFRQAVMSAKGKLTRVRVGPFESQAQADAAAEKIHELKLDAVVFRQ